MNAFDVLGAGIWIVAIKVGMGAYVYGGFTINDLAEIGAQFGVSSVAACP